MLVWLCYAFVSSDALTEQCKQKGANLHISPPLRTSWRVLFSIGFSTSLEKPRNHYKNLNETRKFTN